ncbi:MAG: glycosyltransferase [Chitinophagaceae bacterium]|nr:glycosyltransferase [Bacteroidota bacterium]MCC6258571.1 glycosyltransferase [Chitinophagaceae bacterium]
MKVSIITATYNSARFLEDCIQSVRKQTFLNIEHIVVDGKSTDATLSIIHKHRNHIAKWISETDRGIYDAINKGIEMATGDIIGVLNSDDMLDSSNVIEEIVKAFENKAVDAIYGDLDYVAAEDTSKIIRIWKGRPYKRNRFHYGWMPAHPTFYIRRSLTEKFGLYENHYFTAADYEFMARYLYKNKVNATYLPMLIVKMRMGGESNKSLRQRFRANRRDYLAMKVNQIPFAFLVSILKPLIKLHQFTRNSRNR